MGLAGVAKLIDAPDDELFILCFIGLALLTSLFFFSFGVTIDPGDVISVAAPVAVASGLTLILNLAAGAVAARVRGLDRQAGVNIGLTLLSRGEFALVLATLAAAAGLDDRLAPFVAGYVLVLATGVMGSFLRGRRVQPPPRLRRQTTKHGRDRAVLPAQDKERRRRGGALWPLR